MVLWEGRRILVVSEGEVLWRLRLTARSVRVAVRLAWVLSSSRTTEMEHVAATRGWRWRRVVIGRWRRRSIGRSIVVWATVTGAGIRGTI